MKYFNKKNKKIFCLFLILLGVASACETTETPSTPPQNITKITEILQENPLITGKILSFTYKNNQLFSISKYLGPLLVDSLICTFDVNKTKLVSLKSAISKYSIDYFYLDNDVLNQVIQNIEYEPETNSTNQRHTTIAFIKDSMIYNNNNLAYIQNTNFDDHWVALDTLSIQYKTNSQGDILEQYHKGTTSYYQYNNIKNPAHNLPTALFLDRLFFLSNTYPLTKNYCKAQTTSIAEQIKQESIYTVMFHDSYIDKIQENFSYVTPNETFSSSKDWKLIFE